MIVNERQPLNRAILDFPHKVDPTKWFFWYWNGVRWPSGNREVSILTNKRLNTREQLNGGKPRSWEPMCMSARGIFYDTKEQAVADWDLYGGQYGHKLQDDHIQGYHVSQVADVIKILGYPEGGYVERK